MSPSCNHPNGQNNATTPTSTTKITKPPRPMNCFLLYRHDKQKEILAQCPGANHRDISKIIAKWWRQATAEEKEPYVKKAVQEKIKHAHQYPTYKFTPQKKPKNGTRAYKRRTQDEFTSKSKELNDYMKIMYHASDVNLDPSLGDPILMNAPTTSTTTTTTTDATPVVSAPAISVNMLHPSLLLPPMNHPASYIMNMSSPSSSSLSLSSTTSSPSLLSSPYYHPYACNDTNLYHQKPTTATTSSYLLNDSSPMDCSIYASTGQNMEDNNSHDHIHMDALSLTPTYSDDAANLYVPGDYFYQPQQSSSLFDTSTSPCATIYSNYTNYDHTAYQDTQAYQHQYLERSLSPADFYIDPSFACQDLAFGATTTCPPNALL